MIDVLGPRDDDGEVGTPGSTGVATSGPLPAAAARVLSTGGPAAASRIDAGRAARAALPGENASTAGGHTDWPLGVHLRALDAVVPC